jgi:predicted ATPase
MRIRKLHLKNFKRFTDLTIDNIPDNAKLVLLIGSNGSGKSSIFDAFGYLINRSIGKFDVPLSYYHKNTKPSEINVQLASDSEGKEGSANLSANSEAFRKFIGRSSIRIVPRITNNAFPDAIKDDSDRPASFIDTDTRFDTDLWTYIEKIDNALREPVFAGKSADTLKIFQDQIIPINNSLLNIFGDDATTNIQIAEYQGPTSFAPGKLIFKKGDSKINYDLLSHGEKQVIILLLNFLVRKQYYNDAIIFIDEMDCHLNTALQSTLLKEIVDNWIPDNAQLWTASHSLGFIQYAKESEQAVIFDFDNLDFDIPRVLTPEPKDNSDIYNLAVSKEILPELFKDRDIVFVENEDKKYYASLNIDKILFVPEKNRDSVFFKAKAGQFKGLVDRDLLTDEDIVLIEKEYSKLKILRFYCVENYLFHPENMEEFANSSVRQFDKNNYIKKILDEKNTLKEDLKIRIASIRQTYHYFKEPGKDKSENRKRFANENGNYEQSKIISEYLDSDDINICLKSFSLKDNCKSLSERLNLSPFELSKTNWFKKQIEGVLNS